MRLLSCLLAVLYALAWVPVARADIDIRVGSSANCATASIQAAINAANNINGTTNILIARNISYNNNWLNITGKNVRLIGGYADCDPATPRDSVRTPISGAGGSQIR